MASGGFRRPYAMLGWMHAAEAGSGGGVGGAVEREDLKKERVEIRGAPDGFSIFSHIIPYKG